jgi:phosphatidate cytidylyltransferase
MLATRILTALALAPLVLGALFGLAPSAWALFVLGIVGIGAFEWAALVRWRGPRRSAYAAATVAVGLVLLHLPAAGFDRGWPVRWVAAVCGGAVAFWLLVVPWWLSARWPAPVGVAGALVGWVVLLPAWVALVSLQARSPWVALATMAVVWVADTAAYFVGRAFGRRKLAASISPGKSWEGVYGGLAAVAAYALAVLPVARQHGFVGEATVALQVVWVALAIGLAALSVVGDLFESLLKRHAGVKDSGSILPGHGGILDRTDALLAAMPAAAVAALALLQ